MKELSIFVDESGEQSGGSRYYLITLVFHEQHADLSKAITSYQRALFDKNLPDIPFHASPLMNAHDEYKHLNLETRKHLLNSFNVFVQKLPITYKTFWYQKSEVNTPSKLSNRMRRDLADFIFDRLERFQAFDKIKIYYDGGQQVVTKALHAAIDYTLSKEATMYRSSQLANYRLSQVADYLCAIELTRIKYEHREQTNTDIKIFGYIGTFKKNYLKQAHRKLEK